MIENKWFFLFFIFKRILAMLAIMISLWGMANYTYAECHAPNTGVDIVAKKIYLRSGMLSLADIYDPEDILRMKAVFDTVTCDKTPVYVAIEGSPTAFFKVHDAVFKYDSLKDAFSISALASQSQVDILGSGQAPGAKIFDLYVSDEEMKVGDGWKGLYLISARAEYVDTSRIPANCTLDAPSIINLPDSAPGKQVSASLPVKVVCDKQPATFLAYRLAPTSASSDPLNGVLYDENDIKISLHKDDLVVDMSHLVSTQLGRDNTITDNFKIISDIGKSAVSGEYSTDLVIYLYHS